MKIRLHRPSIMSVLGLALCALSLAASSISIGVTNSPPAPNVESGPSGESR